VHRKVAMQQSRTRNRSDGEKAFIVEGDGRRIQGGGGERGLSGARGVMRPSRYQISPHAPQQLTALQDGNKRDRTNMRYYR